MALGEAVLAEPADLEEALLGELAGVAILEHPFDDLLVKGVDGAVLPPGGHGLTQPVGFVGAEPRPDHGDAHGVFLEEGHAQGFLHHLA